MRYCQTRYACTVVVSSWRFKFSVPAVDTVPCGITSDLTCVHRSVRIADKAPAMIVGVVLRKRTFSCHVYGYSFAEGIQAVLSRSQCGMRHLSVPRRRHPLPGHRVLEEGNCPTDRASFKIAGTVIAAACDIKSAKGAVRSVTIGNH